MEAIVAQSGFSLAQPGWLVAAVLIVPAVALAMRSLRALSPFRRVAAIVLRTVTLLILVVILARPMWTRQAEHITVIAVVDRSLSIPPDLQRATHRYLSSALAAKGPEDQLAVVDVAEAASIAKLPSGDKEVPWRNTVLTGDQTRLADGVQMAMAIAPPGAAVRIVLASEGNETVGNLVEAAKVAASNGIPIDVLPLRYRYDSEVVFKRLVAPVQARSSETIALRCVLESTREATGRLFLYLNGKPVDLDPQGDEVGAHVDLRSGTNVKTLSIPIGTRGAHQFEAAFAPDDPNRDRITQNNRASAMTFVAGPGHILVADTDGVQAGRFRQLLADTQLDIRPVLAMELPDDLARWMEIDAVVLIDTDCSQMTFQQQQVLQRYVKDLGGGLVMIGGPKAFGAGGWIGSPVADVLPVDLDPPQKKQIPKGALVLIMHACEMPMGNYWGKQVAIAAVKTLSRLDLVGLLSYDWTNRGDWVYPLSEVADKERVFAAIDLMDMGDMPDLGAHLQLAYDALKACNAGQKHVIVISDGDPQPPTGELLDRMKAAGITCTGVAIFPHQAGGGDSLLRVAQLTGGRFYNVTDATTLPQIFIKEAQVVKRALIVEESFNPLVRFGLNEVLAGVKGPFPQLDGYVLTGPKEGFSQVVLARDQGDPILATGQAGLGRAVAFTSSLDSRWAAAWLAWPQTANLWEQALRWAARPAQSSDCDILMDVQGRQVQVQVETLDPNGGFKALVGMEAHVIGPDLGISPMSVDQVGPGQFRGQFDAARAGSYILNLRYKAGPDASPRWTQAAVTIPFAPEFSDLADNLPLLTGVAKMTGGRILNADPNQAGLFDTVGVKYPVTQRSLVYPLMEIWLALFLIDVAVRRVAVDLGATARRVRVLMTRRRTKEKGSETMDRLRQTRQKVHADLAGRQVAAKRYDAPADYQGDLNLPKNQTLGNGGEPDKQKGPASDKAAAPGTEASHIEQLLKAKRKAHGHDGEEPHGG